MKVQKVMFGVMMLYVCNVAYGKDIYFMGRVGASGVKSTGGSYSKLSTKVAPIFNIGVGKILNEHYDIGLNVSRSDYSVKGLHTKLASTNIEINLNYTIMPSTISPYVTVGVGGVINKLNKIYKTPLRFYMERTVFKPSGSIGGGIKYKLSEDVTWDLLYKCAFLGNISTTDNIAGSSSDSKFKAKLLQHSVLLGVQYIL